MAPKGRGKRKRGLDSKHAQKSNQKDRKRKGRVTNAKVDDNDEAGWDDDAIFRVSVAAILPLVYSF